MYWKLWAIRRILKIIRRAAVPKLATNDFMAGSYSCILQFCLYYKSCAFSSQNSRHFHSVLPLMSFSCENKWLLTTGKRLPLLTSHKFHVEKIQYTLGILARSLEFITTVIKNAESWYSLKCNIQRS